MLGQLVRNGLLQLAQLQRHHTLHTVGEDY